MWQGEGGGFGWGGVERWGENADDCNWVTIKIKKKKLNREKCMFLLLPD